VQPPVAAASLGQVYRGRLHTGEVVAIKVQRPELEQTINFDLAVLRWLARFAARYPSLTRGVNWEGTLDEFAAVIFEEMDYVQEARNAEAFRYNFRKWREVYVPKIYWSHVSPRVLTMEFIEGTKVIDLQTLDERQINRVEVVRLIARTYLKQLLEDGYFHADPHPGNLRVLDDGRLAFFDFGMVGRITAEMQDKMIDAFFHIVDKDVHGLTQDLINLHFLAPTIDPNAIRPVVEKLFSDYLTLKLGEVRFKELTYELAEVMYEYPFHIPANFTYIIKAIMTLEGVGITLDPKFSFFDVAKPFAKEFMLKREVVWREPRSPMGQAVEADQDGGQNGVGGFCRQDAAAALAAQWQKGCLKPRRNEEHEGERRSLLSSSSLLRALRLFVVKAG
jgi:predicted unusual protein kinase regulating ubiquinone biosynthesis (AarF/ABC1/UbiB family)